MTAFLEEGSAATDEVRGSSCVESFTLETDDLVPQGLHFRDRVRVLGIDGEALPERLHRLGQTPLAFEDIRLTKAFAHDLLDAFALGSRCVGTALESETAKMLQIREIRP